MPVAIETVEEFATLCNEIDNAAVTIEEEEDNISLVLTWNPPNDQYMYIDHWRFWRDEEDECR